jgi:hypothetical protein
VPERLASLPRGNLAQPKESVSGSDGLIKAEPGQIGESNSIEVREDCPERRRSERAAPDRDRRKVALSNGFRRINIRNVKSSLIL